MQRVINKNMNINSEAEIFLKTPNPVMGCDLVYKTVPEAEYISQEAVSKGSSHLLSPAQSEITGRCTQFGHCSF